MAADCVLFLNKNAGALKLTPNSNTIEEYVKELGLDAEFCYPESSEDMDRLIAEQVKKGTKKIVVSGGDGTVRVAAQHLVHSDSVLGILPMGTANNFATALHLPMELAAAIRTIKDGEVTEVSVGKVNDRYFIEGAGVGLFADALALYGAGTNKNIFKGLGTFLRLLLFLPRSRVRITLDNKVIVERAAMCTVANIFRIAQAVPIAPEASLTDDFLDLTIIGDIRRRDLISYYRAIKTQLHGNLPKVQFEKAKTIKLESFRSLNVHVDDQVVGTTPVTITVEPRALKVLTPRL